MENKQKIVVGDRVVDAMGAGWLVVALDGDVAWLKPWLGDKYAYGYQTLPVTELDKRED